MEPSISPSEKILHCFFEVRMMKTVTETCPLPSTFILFFLRSNENYTVAMI